MAALLVAASASGAVAQNADILPRAGAMPLSGTCSVTLDNKAYSRCDCGMAVIANAGRYELSELRVVCGGRANDAAALSALTGAPGRSVQLQYDYAGGSGMWVSTSAATLGQVATHEGLLQLILQLNGPTRFENTQGKACVDGATGARC